MAIRASDHVNRQPPIVVLVHGTWARSRWPWARRLADGEPAIWSDPGSSFMKALSLSLDGDVVFDRFDWSGGNSARARFEAAEALANRIARVRAARPYGIALIAWLMYGVVTAGPIYAGPNWPLELLLWGAGAVGSTLAIAAFVHVGALILAGVVQKAYGNDLATTAPDLQFATTTRSQVTR